MWMVREKKNAMGMGTEGFWVESTAEYFRRILWPFHHSASVESLFALHYRGTIFRRPKERNG